MKAGFDQARAAIDFLWQHQLYPNPTFYGLALLHVAEPDGRLSREIGAMTDGGLRLSEEQASRLAADHLGGGAATEQREREVREHASQLQTITEEAHDLTADMGRDLTTIADDTAARDTLVERMIDRLARAEQQLGDMRTEIADLRGRLRESDRADAGADIDPLTDVHTRRGSAAAMAGLETHPMGYAVALCACDGLEDINERYGRAVGDNVLRAMASTLGRACPEHEVVRWSGNEFVVAMTGVSLSIARTMLHDARASMAARTFRLRGSGELIGTITMSAGLAAGRAEPAEDVIARARAQAAEASLAGGNAVRG